MRTIDADALKEKISADTSLHTWTHEYGTAIPIEWIRSCIDNAPTVEYTFEEAFQKTVCEQKLYCPIRPKGEWIEDSGNIACSHCHTIWLYRYTDFCPNCGADMRGKEE